MKLKSSKGWVAIRSFFSPPRKSTKIKLDELHHKMSCWKGVFIHAISDVEYRENATITYFVHRKYPSLMVINIQSNQDLEGRVFNIQYNVGEISEDISHSRYFNLDNTTSYRTGQNKEPETDQLEPTTFHQVWTIIDEGLTSITFITSIHTDKKETFDTLEKAKKMEYADLLQEHKEEWNRIWKKGSIELSGNKELSRNINAALYNILSSLPLTDSQTNPFVGLSPGGLSRGGKINQNKTGGPSNDYAGHVFWDMDTWVMPPIMMLHPDLATVMLNSRLRVLHTAKENAKLSGYGGARFPWEQAATGTETCPWDLAAKYQIHVTADVSFALRQFIYVSTNKAALVLLQRNGSELALQIAKFWASRVYMATNETYDILGVMGPDEYHYNINNSVFTNYNAKLSLTLPELLQDEYKIYGQGSLEELGKFTDISKKIRILFDEQKQFHPQFEGFSFKDKIKQSDVVLLGFPLLMPMDPLVRKNDLISYEKTTDIFGPDTGTWSMHTVGWLELGNIKKANDMFKILLRNINGPFKVFSEKPANSPDGPRCVNFITGAGGLLQAVMFGYGGIRIREKQLDLDGVLLPNVTQWKMNGINYKSFEFDIAINKTHVTIVVNKSSSLSTVLSIISNYEKKAILEVGESKAYPRGKLSLKEINRPTRATNRSTSPKAIVLIHLYGFVVIYFWR